MTRVTPLPRDLAKLTRSVGSVIAPRSSQMFNNVARSTAARVRREIEHGGSNVPATERGLTTTHRPQAQPTPHPVRTNPLMQAFHTRPANAAQVLGGGSLFVDYAFLPDLSAAATKAAANESFFGRVPLLPDNFAPPRAALPAIFPPEAAEEPEFRAPEIVVVAADPASVSAVSPLTEVEGMGPDGFELSFVHHRTAEDGYAGGMLTGIWA